MNLTNIALIFLAGMGTVIAAMPFLLQFSRRAQTAARKDLHHTHSHPVPRIGGVAIALSFVVLEVLIWAFFPERRASTPSRNPIAIGALAMFALGFLDDLRPLGAKRKLLAQILIAVLVHQAGVTITAFRIPFSEHSIVFGQWSILVTVVWLVGMTNLINLIDGVDGLAGGICLMLMILIAYVGQGGIGTYVFVSTGMAGALIGFLCFNFPPARIYLGDGGAYFLGFLIGACTIVNSQKGTVIAALIAPLVVLALPILDTSIAILRRGLHGLPVFRPDRQHIHHRLLGLGLSRRRVVLAFYGVTLIFLALGFSIMVGRAQAIPLLTGTATLLILLLVGRYSFGREWFAVGRVLGNSLAARQEIHYGLSLTRWLVLEGSRALSTRQLWADILLVTQKLGFTSVRLQFPDGKLYWTDSEPPEIGQVFRFELKGGRVGVLTITSPPSEGDPRTWQILSELLAEGYSRALENLVADRTATVTLDFKVPPHLASLRKPPRTFSCAATRAAPMLSKWAPPGLSAQSGSDPASTV